VPVLREHIDLARCMTPRDRQYRDAMKWTTIRSPATESRLLPQTPPHEILGVSESASRAEIRTAYRRQVRAYHPDHVHPFLRLRSEEMMKAVNAAYRAMIDHLPR
jgi:DnaJ-class molecular chaperone